MAKDKLLKKLKTDPRFLPYNEKYDFEHILEYLQKTIDPDENLSHKENALNSLFFNNYYKEFKLYYNEIIAQNNLSKDTFLELIITLANRDLYLAISRTHKSFGNKEELNYDEISNSSFKSNIPELGNINVQAGLEAGHDGLNTLMNLVTQNFTDSNNSLFNINHLDNCANLLGFSNIYVVIKSAYDMAIWEDYALQLDASKEELKIKILDEKNQILNRIGEYRLKRNVFSSKSIILSAFQENNALYQSIAYEANKNRKTKRLKSIKLIESEINFKLGDGIDKESVLQEILSFVGLTTYYAFIKNEILPNFNQMKLYDVLIIFTEVQHLFSDAFKINKVENATDIQDFNLYRIKIKKSDLINYILSKTKYSRIQVKEIIELFIHKDGYHNIWERPIIEFGGYLIPVMLPLLSPNTLRMTDYWLEKGGFDLDSRGFLFEKYIKYSLLQILKRKGFKATIPSQNIFRNKNDEFEEIDLILELKNITIIAEVKCIKYPFDPRDYHNMYSRLLEGVTQINRKVSFIQTNIEDFKNELYLLKPFVKLVITNLPLFSGHVIDGVSITDFSLIENYFISGSLSKGRMVMEKKGFKIDDSFQSGIKYYTNENEFSDNLEKFFMNPIPISEKLKDINIEETQITLPNSNPKIIMDYVNFKQTNQI